jgi:hypothetical protein
MSWADRTSPVRSSMTVTLAGVWHAAKAAIPRIEAAATVARSSSTSSGAGLFAMENIGYDVAAKHGAITVNTPMAQNEPSCRLFRLDLEHPTTADLNDVPLTLNALPIPWVEPVAAGALGK